MEVSIKRRISDGIKHRYVTGLEEVPPAQLDYIISDVLGPTYIADMNMLDNSRALTISPMLGKMLGATSIPFNKLISLSGIDFKKLQKDIEGTKKRELVFAAIGYGGLGMNILHFMSLLSYRTGVHEVFKELHVFESDRISYTNLPRFYKDLFNFPLPFGLPQNKLAFFNEMNLAERITLHEYRLDESVKETMDTYGNVVYFGAPDFETRALLENSNFMFAGHQGDNVIIVKSPVVDADLTQETYGTVNLTAFFINMIVATASVFDLLSRGLDSFENDSVLFQHNSKERIKSTLEKERVLNEEQDICVYKYTDKLKIAI